MSFQELPVSQTTALVLVLEDGATNRHPQAEIYAPGSSVPSETIDLPHLAQGRYEESWTPTTVGEYIILYLVYSDIGHTTLSTRYSRELDKIRVVSASVADIEALLRRILGLVQENTFRDNTVFDSCGQIVGARIRIFDSKVNCAAATDGGTESAGLVATYTMSAEFEGPNKLKTYKVVKE